MTATVTVRTRAWPATVTHKTAEGEPITTEIAGRSETSFNVEDTADFTVKINPPEAGEAEAAAPVENARPFEGEKVPGAEKNDLLLGRSARRPAHVGD
jgi:hypothetical protein